ncbi:MAG: hypothetical protein JO125_06080 [Chloroflexi bacterium]|nr:hypothetical protein [Ktedonobacteraceae bacterium]MBV9706955.1 hypothetical protein [Chloroflexota bacterium]
MIPYSRTFDQQTLTHMIEHDPVVQRYRAFFASFDWSVVPEPVIDPSQPGQRPHPQAVYIKALLLKLEENLTYCTRLRRFLVEHPLLVLELGFRPVLNVELPYGFDVERTVPTARWFTHQQRTLSRGVLQTVLLRTVEDLRDEIAGLGEVVSFDVTHIYAWVRENNPRVYVQGPFDVTHIPKGDPDCRLGVKKSSNQEQADGTVKKKKESLFGYGSGIASCTDPVYGDVILAEYTQPFNQGDITYFFPLYVQTVATLGFFPTHLAADAAFDAWYCYQATASRGGIAAIPLNEHGHPESRRDTDGVPLCAKGLRMHPTCQFSHTYGYRAQRFRCPLLFPHTTDAACDHAQFVKGTGCVKDLNWELGGQMRVTLHREGPLYKGVYRQRTSTERGNSHAQALGLKRPKVRNMDSVRNLNTLIYLLINARALQRARTLNAGLLTTMLGKVA